LGENLFSGLILHLSLVECEVPEFEHEQVYSSVDSSLLVPCVIDDVFDASGNQLSGSVPFQYISKKICLSSSQHPIG
jgi:hypothetical protein